MNSYAKTLEKKGQKMIKILKILYKKMEEVSQQSEADLRQGRVLKNKTISDDDKMDKLEKELINAVTIERETAARCV